MGEWERLREFLYVEDLAASFFLLRHYNEHETFNVGSSEEISIRNLTEMIAEVVGYSERSFRIFLNPMELPERKPILPRCKHLAGSLRFY